MVDHAMIAKQKAIPAALCKLKKREPRARQQKGSKEYPRMLIVEYSST